ncbi:MAG: AAA family ATPase [Candidatus Jordarchaeaceae archaeon]
MIFRVRLQNWKNYEEGEFEFKEGLNLIFGPNASGKTSILQAIFYALNGEPPDKQNLLNFRRFKSGEACVELNFASRDGCEYLVRRYISGEKKVSERAYLYSHKNGEQPTEIASGPEEVNKLLGEILGFGTQYFLRTIYMKEGDVYEFLQNPSGKVLSEIDQMLQMDKIITLIEKVNSLSKEKSRELKSLRRKFEETKTPSPEKMVLEKAREDLENKLNSVKAKIEELLVQQATVQEASSILEKIIDVEQRVMGSKNRLDQLVAGLKGEDAPKERLEAAIRKTEQELQGQRSKANEMLSKISALKSGIREGNEKLQKLEAAGDRCPLCNQPLTPEHMKRIHGEFSETLQKLQKELQESEKEYGKTEEKMKTLEISLSDLQAKRREMEIVFEELRRLNEEKSRLDKQFPAKQPKNQDKLKSTLSEIKSQIEQKQAEKEAVKKDIILMEARVGASSESAAKLEKEVRSLAHQEFVINTMLEALQRTVRRLREEKLVQVKQKAARLLANFKPGIWSVNWDEKFVPQLASPEISLSAYQLSGAEKLQLFLAVRLAMASTIGEPDFILLDEPAYHLDPQRRKLVYGILKDYLESTGIRQLIVTSFEPELEEQEWNNKITLQ